LSLFYAKAEGKNWGIRKQCADVIFGIGELADEE